MCLRVLAERNELLTHVFGEASREALSRLLLTRDAETKKKVSILSGYFQDTLRILSGYSSKLWLILSNLSILVSKLLDSTQ